MLQLTSPKNQCSASIMEGFSSPGSLCLPFRITNDGWVSPRLDGRPVPMISGPCCFGEQEYDFQHKFVKKNRDSESLPGNIISLYLT